MNVLVKFPTRGRRERFFETLGAWRSKQSGRHPVQYVVTMDVDDVVMMADEARSALDAMGDVSYRYGEHGSKVEAINADMGLADPRWELLVLASDDMVPEEVGWDEVMASDLRREFPDTDGALWYYDGYCRTLCTLSVLGRRWYDRFGYIYHPSYVSLWCDNEHTEVARRAGKLWQTDRVVVRHRHPYHGGGLRDKLLERNEAFFKTDSDTYRRREKAGFPA